MQEVLPVLEATLAANSPLLIMANKQDDSRAMAPREITEKLQLYSLANRNWYIVDTKATHPDAGEANLHAGLDWLYETLSTPAAQRQERARLEHRERARAQDAGKGKG